MPAKKTTKKAARKSALRAAVAAEVSSGISPEDARRHQLLALKDQLSDLIDSQTPAQRVGAPIRSSRSGSSAMSGPRLAIVVGHSKIDGGGLGLPPVNPNEYLWNSDLAEKIKAAGAASGIAISVFFRDGVGISGAYKNVAEWGATAIIELHYNNNGGKARGTETLWGPACSRSEAWATAIHAAMVQLYGRTGKLDRGTKKTPPHPRGAASVNALSHIPSCLIEPFFGDNPDDAALGGAKKQQLATILVSTFTTQFNTISAAIPVAIQGKRASLLSSYTLPASAAKFIRNIDLKSARPFDPGEQIKGLAHLRIIGGNVVFTETDLATDADGSPRARQIDPYGQLETAFNFSNQTGQARYVNAERIPYIVLAGSNTPSPRPREKFLYNRLGLKLGDIAAVIWKDRIDFAMFADSSANDNMGEGSIALVESLGWNPWNSAKTKIISGIPDSVITFVFPGSKIAGLTPQNAAEKIRSKGLELFKSIGGTIA